MWDVLPIASGDEPVTLTEQWPGEMCSPRERG